jgi:hypothetical protein
MSYCKYNRSPISYRDTVSESLKWKEAGDGDYKINLALPDSRRFVNAKHFLEKFRF